MPLSASAERVKDLASVLGVRDNQLLGYGLVVGLDGTGDQGSPHTIIAASPPMPALPDLAAIRAAHERIARYVHRTPVLTSRSLDAATGAAASSSSARTCRRSVRSRSAARATRFSR